MQLWTECELAAKAVALGARKVPGWSLAEERLAQQLPDVSPREIEDLKKSIQQGEDPLGELFCMFRPAAERRKRGATYTPASIVAAMLTWAQDNCNPARVVDPGVGSGRFLVEAGRRFKGARLVGVEIDPMGAIIARGTLAASGLSGRAEIVLGDYRRWRLPAIDGQTLFIGNPPYVRHHLLHSKWKAWLTQEAKKCGLIASQLAGLHVYFYLATALKARQGDYGSFITAAEWLDVNYGKLVRELFLGALGGRSIVVIEPTASPFPDAASTAAITTFRIGAKPRAIKLRRVGVLDKLGDLSAGKAIGRERLEQENRWSHLTRAVSDAPAGFVELGELCRVHRGQVTGANKVWIEGPHSSGLPPSVLFPTITRARELFEAERELIDASHLRRVIDLPEDLSVFDNEERRRIDTFLKRARELGGHLSYIARNRRAWWSVGLRKPAPVLATYMARRPPAFVRNFAEARHLNIAHGIYPREALSERVLTGLVRYLSTATDMHAGRTYAGGLTKFEPREMERIPVPSPEVLSSHAP